MHIPVLQKEVLEYLNPKPNENFIDCTVGEGGHTLAIAEQILPNGRVLGIDWSSDLIQKLKIAIQKTKIKNNLIFVCQNFVNLKTIAKVYKFKYKFKQVKGILFDLGMSSWHLEKSKRGFSFLRNEPLDMRYNSGNPLTAQKIINQWSENKIEKIIKEYGEERFSKRIVKEIIRDRQKQPIKTTFQLVGVLKKAIPSKFQHRRIHFATRTFQALRIAVNNELENLKEGLSQALEVLTPGGRLVIISFHSGEDRIVKNFFKEKSPRVLKILTKKPIIPSDLERKINPRSRSAKLRAAEKLL